MPAYIYIYLAYSFHIGSTSPNKRLLYTGMHCNEVRNWAKKGNNDRIVITLYSTISLIFVFCIKLMDNVKSYSQRDLSSKT